MKAVAYGYIREAAEALDARGFRIVLRPTGVVLMLRRGLREATQAIDWAELERSRVNPLLMKADRMDWGAGV